MTLLPASQAVLRLVDILGCCEKITFTKVRLSKSRFLKHRATEAYVRKIFSLEELDAWCAAGLPHEDERPHRTFDGMQFANWLFAQEPPLENIAPADDANLIRAYLQALPVAVNACSEFSASFPLFVRADSGGIAQMAGHSGPCWHELAYLLGRSRYLEWLKAIDDRSHLDAFVSQGLAEGSNGPIQFPPLPAEQAIRQWERIIPTLKKHVQPIDAEALKAGVLREATLAANARSQTPSVAVDLDAKVVIVEGQRFMDLAEKHLRIIQWLLEANGEPLGGAIIAKRLNESKACRCPCPHVSREIDAIKRYVPPIAPRLHVVGKKGYRLDI